MYSRKSNRSSVPPHLPEHYRGWAFQPQPAPPSDRPTESPKKPNIPQNPLRPPQFLPPPKPHDEPPCTNENPPPPPFSPPSLGHLFGGNGSPHISGLNFDELLIIGLIFLLSGNGEDNELPLLLALLLFCG